VDVYSRGFQSIIIPRLRREVLNFRDGDRYTFSQLPLGIGARQFLYVQRFGQPVIPLSKAKLEIFLRFVSCGSLTLPDVQRALLQPSGQINVLKTLIPLYTSKVPWGSLAYHYSTTSINSLAPEDVFEKLVIRGLGGHCLEMVPLFASVLRSLGYDLYLSGARKCGVGRSR